MWFCEITAARRIVQGVSTDSAFATWVGGRLPTESEWEFAARSRGRAITSPWGNEPADCTRANVNNCFGFTSPVCNYPRGLTAQGLCDMAGNVHEWLEDDFHGNYAGAPNDGSAWIDSPRSPMRIMRGGSWSRTADFATVHRRWAADFPSFLSSTTYGFRGAR